MHSICGSPAQFLKMYKNEESQKAGPFEQERTMSSGFFNPLKKEGMESESLNSEMIRKLQEQQLNQKDAAKAFNKTMRAASSNARVTTAFTSNFSPSHHHFLAGDNKQFSSPRQIFSAPRKSSRFQSRKVSQPSIFQSAEFMKNMKTPKQFQINDIEQALEKSKSLTTLNKKGQPRQIISAQQNANFERKMTQRYEAESCLLDEVSGDPGSSHKQLISMQQLQGMILSLKKKVHQKKQKTYQEKMCEALRNQSTRSNSLKTQERFFNQQNLISPEAFSKYIRETKEERAIKSYETSSKGWTNHTELVKKKTNREQRDQIFERIELHRKLEEEINSMEILKPYVEKFGARHWEYGLRSDQNQDEGEMRLLPMGPPLSNLYCHQFQKGQNYLPFIIRKPHFKELSPQSQEKQEEQTFRPKKKLTSNRTLKIAKNSQELRSFVMGGKKKSIQDNPYFQQKLKRGELKKFKNSYMSQVKRVEQNVDFLKVIAEQCQVSGKSKIQAELKSVQKQLKDQNMETSSDKSHFVLHFFPDSSAL